MLMKIHISDSSDAASSREFKFKSNKMLVTLIPILTEKDAFFFLDGETVAEKIGIKQFSVQSLGITA